MNTNPPVSNYDDEAEPSGERAGRLAYIAAHDKAYAADQQRLEAMRYAVYHSDTEIKMRDDGIYGNAEATLWKIRGVPKTFYPTKIAAEVAARAHFPHDNPTVRYSRISFVEINFEYEEDPC
jgi:hypothetical protein